MRSLPSTIIGCIVTIVTIASTQMADARVGGYSHRSKQQAIPQQPSAMPIPTPQHNLPPVHEVMSPQELAQSLPLTIPVTPAINDILPALPIAHATQLPPPPTANNAYELMNMLESQNKQLREQISLLERESNILVHRNRALSTDKRRLQRKKRKLAEQVDSLKEQILRAASRPPRLNEGRLARYSQRTSRK